MKNDTALNMRMAVMTVALPLLLLVAVIAVHRATHDHKPLVAEETVPTWSDYLAHSARITALEVRVGLLEADPDPIPDPDPDPIPDPDPDPIPDPGPAQLVYVDADTGDDTAAGSLVAPLRTIAAAYARLPDSGGVIRLARGDVWIRPTLSNDHQGWKPSFTVEAYGPLSEARPQIVNAQFLMGSGGSDIASAAFTSIDFNSDPAHGEGQTGVVFSIHGRVDNLTFEDCAFRHMFGGALGATNPGDQAKRNWVFRRCQFQDMYSTTSHSSGMFIEGVDGLTIADCYFDYIGWREGIPGAERTVYNHCLYIRQCSNALIENCVFSRGSNFGVKLRSDEPDGFTGVTVRDCLFWDNGSGITVGGKEGTGPRRVNGGVFQRNTFIGGGFMQTPTAPQALGVYTSDNADLLFEDNLFVDRPIIPEADGWETATVMWFDTPGVENVRVNRTTVHRWRVQKPQLDTIDADHGGVVVTDLIEEREDADFVDATRTLDTLLPPGEGGAGQVRALMRVQREGIWNPALEAKAIGEWLREGYTLTTP